jgi:hypothetical protein
VSLGNGNASDKFKTEGQDRELVGFAAEERLLRQSRLHGFSLHVDWHFAIEKHRVAYSEGKHNPTDGIFNHILVTVLLYVDLSLQTTILSFSTKLFISLSGW